MPLFTFERQVMIVGTITRLTVPDGQATVSAVLTLLDESTNETSTATIPTDTIKTLASLDKVPQIGDKFNLNMWKIVQ